MLYEFFSAVQGPCEGGVSLLVSYFSIRHTFELGYFGN